MSSFRTELSPERAKFDLTHSDPVLTMGSCFAQNIGRQLELAKFPTLANPFGTLYHPLVILRALARIRSGKPIGEEELYFHDEKWLHFDFHSQFDHADKEECLRRLNQAFSRARGFMQKTRRLVLTFGTANGYSLSVNNRLVANCHKLPNRLFDRRRWKVAEIVNPFSSLVQELKEELPDLEIILTLSPVRHLRDGLLDNQKSKSTLLLAMDQLCRRFSFVHYFPAYEMMMDDLRDYRFYEADMLHPNATAINYIWKHFQQVFFSAETLRLIHEIEAIQKACQHRPFHPESQAHLTFVKKQLDRIGQLEKEAPQLDFAPERQKLVRSLN